ncbi:hypothetical protein [Roseococcus sp.]|uniref:hypothetical protein n=1 Tax=Roseococcus sp. TaxID=2109646 RepID=UPI003BABE56E
MSETTNPLAMSDDDFLKLVEPVVVEPAPIEPPAAVAEVVTPEPEAVVVPEVKEPEGTEALTEAELAAAKEGEEPAKPEEKTVEGESKLADPAAHTPEAAPAAKVEAQAPAEPVNYEELYTKILKPFRANGRDVEVKNADEAIQLMQMGANYTRKMQELAPHRKVLMMLEKNGLLDEGKLGFLIDIEKRDPAAIQKLVKDSGLDPMDIDVSAESKYRAGAHQVGDDEVKFMAVLEDLKSSPEGQETIKVIDSGWDEASKNHLWANPEAMTTIHQHRASGVYDRINAEVGRQRTLGTIAADVPYLQAYRALGEKMADDKAFDDLLTPTAPAAPPAPEPKVVAVRVATPQPEVANSDKAAAAASSRTTPATAKAFVNPLAMSDDDFLKQFEGRV